MIFSTPVMSRKTNILPPLDFFNDGSGKNLFTFNETTLNHPDSTGDIGGTATYTDGLDGKKAMYGLAKYVANWDKNDMLGKDFTVSVFIKSVNYDDSHILAFRFNESNWNNSDGYPSRIENGTYTTSISGLNQNTWRHLCVTRRSNTLYWFVDGALNHSEDGELCGDNTGSLVLNYTADNNVIMQQLRMITRSVSDTEVNQLKQELLP